MELVNGQTIIINNYEYLVLNKLGNYALLLNKNFSPNKNGGDIVLVKNDANSQLVEVEKNKEIIKDIITKMMNNNE